MIDQNLAAFAVYIGTSLVMTALGFALFIGWAVLPRGKHWTGRGRTMLAFTVFLAAEAFLAVWFGVSRWESRPEPMFESWWPVVARGGIVAAALIGLSAYRRGHLVKMALASTVATAFLTALLLWAYGV